MKSSEPYIPRHSSGTVLIHPLRGTRHAVTQSAAMQEFVCATWQARGTISNVIWAKHAIAITVYQVRVTPYHGEPGRTLVRRCAGLR